VTNVAIRACEQIRRLRVVTNVSSGATLDRPELRIYPRRELAVRLGVSTESLSETIRVATIGDVGPALAKFRCRGTGRYRGEFCSTKRRAPTSQVLEQIRIPIPDSERRAASQRLADIGFDASPVTISRYEPAPAGRVSRPILRAALR